jgi:nucleoredoxin
MIGDKFVDAQGKAVGAEAVSPAKAKVLALYFSASWCKPCREFTPRLAELYKKLKAEGKELEVRAWRGLVGGDGGASATDPC